MIISAFITDTAPSVTLGGTISAGSVKPSGNVLITLNGLTQPAAITSDGSFSTVFAGPFPVAGSPFAVMYHYGGDANFNAAADGFGTVTIIDTTPPTITSSSASPEVLWPPDHALIPIGISIAASDNSGNRPVCSVTAVRGNDGTTADDWRITGSLTLVLRSTRSGAGTGRTYRVDVTCQDSAENQTMGTIAVMVPHDQGVN
jgi:hypothetical protein